jgi:coatomer subunit beta
MSGAYERFPKFHQSLSSCFSQEHRHSYVRKNAVLAVYSIYRSFEQLIPDAPELMQTFLAAESDTTCKRNAFIFLANCATHKAVEWVVSVYDQILGFEDLMQLVIIDMIRKDCRGDTPNRVLFFHSIP